MTKLTLIKSKPIVQQITEETEAIQLPLFDIFTHEDDEFFDAFDIQKLVDDEDAVRRH